MFSILNEAWVAPTIVIIALVILIGNLSTFQKSAKTPLRKKSLNDLKETIPRTQKSPHKPKILFIAIKQKTPINGVFLCNNKS